MSKKFSTLVLGLACVAAAHAQTPAYKITATHVLGGNGGWDYIIPDASNHRLFIARATRLMVVDENSGKLLAEVAGINGAHGTALATGTNFGYATASEDKAVIQFDAKTYKILKKIPAADDADAIVYDAPSHRVFSLNGDANNATVIDANTGTVVKNLPLGGKPEYGVSTGNGKLYVNLQDKNQIAEIDTASATIARTWPTTGCEQPTAMAIDTAHRRLFSGCRNGVLAVSDYAAGKVIATAPIGKGTDGAGFDPSTSNVLTSNLDGTLSIIHQDDADHYHALASLTTFVGSRNMAVDPQTHKIYVVSAKFGPVPAGGKRPPVLPGSFSLNVIEPAR